MSHTKKFDCQRQQNLLKQLEEDELISLIKETRLFGNISPQDLTLKDLSTLCKTVEIEPLDKNKSLDIADPQFLYEILSGYVKIYDRVVSTPDLTNLPALLAWRIPRDLLGDFQFTLSNHHQKDHIVATDDCQLLKIPVSLVKSLGQRHPQIYLNLASNLADKAVKARVRAQVLRLPNMRCKMAKLFLELHLERGCTKIQNGARVLNGSFKNEDFAAFLGYKKRAVSQGIASLKRKHLIKHYENRRSGRFEIPDPELLNDYLALELAKASKRTKPS